jgi:hypothetical protein
LQIGAFRGKNPGCNYNWCQGRTLRVYLLSGGIHPALHGVGIQVFAGDIGIIQNIAINNFMIATPPAAFANGFPL